MRKRIGWKKKVGRTKGGGTIENKTRVWRRKKAKRDESAWTVLIVLYS